MKKTIKVNIGGFSYNLDEDAYNALNNYLDELKTRLGNGTEARETLSDIEERISELFASKLEKQEVVTLAMVEEVINQLGKPEEIGENTEYNQKPSSNKIQKRLYRSPEDSIIAGVCSGLAEYFAIDPIVIRLLFVLIFFLKGFGLLLYLILWIATPKAISPKQKLEMKGEPVTLSNIEKNLKEEIDMVTKNIKKAEPKNFFEKFMNFLGQIAYWCLKALLIVFKVIAIIIGIIIITSMLFTFIVLIGTLFFGGYVLSWIAPEVGGFSINEFITSMFDISSSIWVTIPIFLILAIPVVALIYAGFRIIFRFKARDGIIGVVAAVVWVAAVVTLALTVFFQARSLTIRESVVNTISLDASANSNQNKIILKSIKYNNDFQYDESNIHYNFFDLTLTTQNGKKTISGKPNLIIEKSDEQCPNITLIKKARGGNKTLAKQNASEIIYNYTIQDSTITIDPTYTLPNNIKWKNQDITLILNLPLGSSVYLDSTVLDLLDYNQPYCNYWPDEMIGKTWTMTKNGLREKRQ
ncbi:MAG: PspC domain-containing protein [Bacteroidales bacterium]